jgi:hypothetical protein
LTPSSLINRRWTFRKSWWWFVYLTQTHPRECVCLREAFPLCEKLLLIWHSLFYYKAFSPKRFIYLGVTSRMDYLVPAIFFLFF